jgi:hypothetical protein
MTILELIAFSPYPRTRMTVPTSGIPGVIGVAAMRMPYRSGRLASFDQDSMTHDAEPLYWHKSLFTKRQQHCNGSWSTCAARRASHATVLNTKCSVSTPRGGTGDCIVIEVDVLEKSAVVLTTPDPLVATTSQAWLLLISSSIRGQVHTSPNERCL